MRKFKKLDHNTDLYEMQDKYLNYPVTLILKTVSPVENRADIHVYV